MLFSDNRNEISDILPGCFLILYLYRIIYQTYKFCKGNLIRTILRIIGRMNCGVHITIGEIEVVIKSCEFSNILVRTFSEEMISSDKQL